MSLEKNQLERFKMKEFSHLNGNLREVERSGKRPVIWNQITDFVKYPRRSGLSPVVAEKPMEGYKQGGDIVTCIV